MSSYQSGLIKGDDPNVTKLYGERTAKNNCQYLLPYIKSDSNILDVGCGPGVITSNFSKLASQGHTTGIDSSEGIIAEATAAFPPASNTNLTFAVGDAYDLSRFPDNSFGIVHAHQVICHLKDPVAALKEFNRVVKPGGIVAVRDSSPQIVLSLKPELAPIRQFWDRSVAFMPKIGINPSAGLKLPEWANEAGLGAGDGGKIEYTKSPAYNPSHLSSLEGERGAMALQFGLANEAELASWKAAWEEWQDTEGSEFVFEAGEILAWKGN